MRLCLNRFAAAALILFSAALPAYADDLSTLVSALGSGSFAEKEQAVAALGKLGDRRAIPVLTALREGRLAKAADGRVVIAGSAKAADAISGAEISDVSVDALERILSTIGCAAQSRRRWAL